MLSLTAMTYFLELSSMQDRFVLLLPQGSTSRYMDEKFKHCGHQRQFYAGHHQKGYLPFTPVSIEDSQF